MKDFHYNPVPFPIFVMELGLTTNISLWSDSFSRLTLLHPNHVSIWGSLSDRRGKPMLGLSRYWNGYNLCHLCHVFKTISSSLLFGINGLLSGYTPAAITLVAAQSRPDNLNYSGYHPSCFSYRDYYGSVVGAFLLNHLESAVA